MDNFSSEDTALMELVMRLDPDNRRAFAKYAEFLFAEQKKRGQTWTPQTR